MTKQYFALGFDVSSCDENHIHPNLYHSLTGDSDENNAHRLSCLSGRILGPQLVLVLRKN